MRALLAASMFAFFLVLTTTAARPTEAPTPAESWRPLFDGKSLDGWEHIGPGKMVLDEGLIRTEGGMGLLWYTKEKFGNCVIRVVYKTGNKESNAGVFIRIAEKPKDP